MLSVKRTFAEAYLHLFRIRSSTHWLWGVLLGYLPSALLACIIWWTNHRHLFIALLLSLAMGCLWSVAFIAYRNSLSLTITSARTLAIHLPRSFVLEMIARRSTEPFLESATETVFWAIRNGFHTVTLDSPLLAKGMRRKAIAAELQRRCGDAAIVAPIEQLRRTSWFYYQAFMLSRRSAVNVVLARIPVSLVRNWAVPPRQNDGFLRHDGRLLSGKIVVSRG